MYRGRAESLSDDDVLMLNKAARPQVNIRNGWDDVNQEIPKGTAWVVTCYLPQNSILPFLSRKTG